MSGLKHLAAVLALICFPIVAALPAAQAQTTKIVGFGDSLMAGYQLPNGKGLPGQLEQKLQDKGFDVEITNAGVSGDTTTGGLQRLDWSIPEGTDLVILELGANDALRGLPPEKSRQNLDAILSRLKERGIAILLAGMLAPPNLGRDYENEFNTIYPDLAEKHNVVLYPFILEGVITDKSLLLPDGIHPNEEGVARMADGIAPYVEEMLSKLGQ